MCNTSNSDRSTYFDAPLAHFFSMSNSLEGGFDRNAALQASAAPEGSSNLNDANNAHGHQDSQPMQNDPNNAHGNQDSQPMQNNPSLGWLPTVDHPVEPTATEFKHRHSILKHGGAADGNTVTNLHERAASPSSSIARLSAIQPINRNAEEPHSVDVDNVNGAANVHRATSLSRRSVFTTVDGRPASAFSYGAGTIATVPSDELSARVASADAVLTASQKQRINNLEAKEAKRLSKIIKAEGKVEKKALDVAIDELAEWQNLQKKAIKDEAKALVVHTKLLDDVRKYDAEFMDAKVRYETTLARLHAQEQMLERVKEYAREATQQTRVRAQEVDGLRAMFGVDERERELRVMQLVGKKTHSSFWS